jgi:hypothetical protein
MTDMKGRLTIIAAAAMSCALSACGGGSASTDRAEPAADVQRVTFPEVITRTVFQNGAISFQISPVRQSSEHVTCSVDSVEVSPCLLDDSHGQIQFSGLASGSHVVSVQLSQDASQPASRVDHQLSVESVQLIVFGATPGGIASAIAAARSGLKVALLEPSDGVGGMMSNGLARTDVGPRSGEIIGGIAAEFLGRVQAEEQASGACSSGCEAPFDLESRVARHVFESMLGEANVIVERDAGLQGVVKDAAVIQGLQTTRGDVAGQIFIDASYEGDLMAHAGVEYAIGREPRVLAAPDDPSQLALQEDNAGVMRYRVPMSTLRADPFVVPGDPTSGALPFVEPRPAVMPVEGEGDGRVMAYTWRLCVTDDPSNRIAFTAPPDYDPSRYEAAARVAQALAQSGADLATQMFNPARTVLSKDRAHYKYDLNGGSTFSSDMTAPGLNQAYVEGSEVERERIRSAYRSYVAGLLYFWQTDPRLQSLNQKVASFGYCADEFTDHEYWPRQLYVREARRMRGEYVMNEADVMQNGRRPAIVDPVGFGSYDIDLHAHRYFAAPVDWPDGSRREAIVVEGFRIVSLPDHRPYPVSYRALVPQARDATNLLDPVTLSATQVAYGSLRTEPTFLILGEAAGVAASIAVERQIAVQAVPYDELRDTLLSRGQRITD